MHGVVGKVIRLSLYLTLGATLAACGGGASRAAPPATYAVGGTVTGLTGSGLVLTSDFGGDLALSVSGAFVFSTRLSSGNIFNVGVKTNPTSPLQLCQIQHGSGTVTAANVSMTVTCGN